MKLNARKIISLLLSLAMLTGCIFVSSITVSAAITGSKVDYFNYLKTAEDVAAAISPAGGNTTLPWTHTASSFGTCTFSLVGRGSSNEPALKWSGVANNTGSAWNTGYWPSNKIYLGNDIAETDPVGTEAWISFDFMMEEQMFQRQIYVGNWNSSSLWSILLKDKNATTAKFNGIASSKTIVDNGWHTISACVEKLETGAETRIYLDGILTSKVESADIPPFSNLVIQQGYTTDLNKNTGSIGIDTLKTWKNTEGEDEDYTLYKFSTAADWGAAPAGSTITDVDGSNGKAADDKAVKMEAAAGGNVPNVNKSVAVNNVIPTARYDVIMEFDMKANDLNWKRNIGWLQGGSTKALTIGETGSFGNLWGLTVHNPSHMLTPVGQWNHYSIRYTREGNAYIYVNGNLEGTYTNCGADTAITTIYWWAQYGGSAATIPGFSTEMDDYIIRLCPVAESEAYCTTPRRVYRNYDFKGVESGAGYNVINGLGATVAANSDVTYSSAVNAADNIVSGKAGKTSNDKIMAFSGSGTDPVWKQVSYDSQKSLWSNLALGSVVRGGASIMFEADSVGDRDTTLALTVYPTTPEKTGVMSQISLLFNATAKEIQIKDSVTDTELTSVSKNIIRNKWYRVEYVLNIADQATGSANTVDFYLDGKLLTETPITVNYDYPSDTTQDDSDPVSRVTFGVIDYDINTLYVDDLTAEYLPAGATSSELNKKVALKEANDEVYLNPIQGAITLLDAGKSQITLDQLNALLCDDTQITAVAADGTTIAGGSIAAGNYAVMKRDIWPDIFYTISDIDVTVANGTITANMPYDGDNTTVMLMAIYDDEDNLVDASVDKCEDGQLQASLPTEGGTEYRVYLWKSLNNMQPYYAQITGAIAQ